MSEQSCMEIWMKFEFSVSGIPGQKNDRLLRGKWASTLQYTEYAVHHKDWLDAEAPRDRMAQHATRHKSE